MPGEAVKHYLMLDPEPHFDKLVQVFRHDFVLYAGMLLSWFSLFDSEIMAQAEPPAMFATTTAALLQSVQQIHDRALPHLYPTLPATVSRPQQIVDLWETYYNDFVVLMRPPLVQLEPQIRTYTAQPEFETIIQKNLGALTDNDDIGHLVFNAYGKLMLLFKSGPFDQRVARLLVDEPKSHWKDRAN